MTHSTEPTGLLNTKQVARKFGITDKTLRIWLRGGRSPVDPIPGMKPPKWRASDIDVFLAGRTGL